MLKMFGFAFLQIKVKFTITSRQEIKIVRAFQNLEIASNLKKVLFGICQGENIQRLIRTLRSVNVIIPDCQITAILIHLVRIQIHATMIHMVMADLERARKCLSAVKCNCVRVSTDTHRHSSLMPFALLEQEPEMTK